MESTRSARAYIHQFNGWRRNRRRTVTQFRALIRYLHKLELAVDITNVATSVVSLPFAAACIAAGFVTMGASAIIGVTVTGIVIGMGAAATNLAQMGIKEKKQKAIKAAVEADRVQTGTLLRSLYNLEATLSARGENISLQQRTICKAILDFRSVGVMAVNAGAVCFKGVRMAKIVEEGVETVLETTSKLGKTAGAVLGGIAIAFDVLTIATASHSLAKGSKCSLGLKVEAVTGLLERELESVQSLTDTIQENI